MNLCPARCLRAVRFPAGLVLCLAVSASLAEPAHAHAAERAFVLLLPTEYYRVGGTVAVWTLWWVGLTLAQAALADLWAYLNPWAGPYRLLARLARRAGMGPAVVGRSVRRRRHPCELRRRGDDLAAPGRASRSSARFPLRRSWCSTRFSASGFWRSRSPDDDGVLSFSRRRDCLVECHMRGGMP